MEAWDGLYNRLGQGEAPECPYTDTVRTMLWKKMNVAAHDINIDRRRLADLENQVSEIKESIHKLTIEIEECDAAINKLS